MGLALVVGIVILVLVVAIQATLLRKGVDNAQPLIETRANDMDGDGNPDNLAFVDKCFGDEDPDYCTPWNDQRDGPGSDSGDSSSSSSGSNKRMGGPQEH